MNNAREYSANVSAFTRIESGKNPQKAGLEPYVFGKLQPQALPLEEAVLGALMIDRDAFGIVSDILRPETFYLRAHQLIFTAISALADRQNPVDMLTVTQELRQMGELENIGNAYYIAELTNRVASAANIEYHAYLLRQKAMARELIGACTSALRLAYEDTTDVFDLLSEHEMQVAKIAGGLSSKPHQFGDVVAMRLLDSMHKASEKPEGLSGVPSGIMAVDRETGGWQATDLVIVAARPGMGKTGFLLSNVLNEIEFGRKVGVFSLEMSAEQLTARLLSMVSNIDVQKFRRGNLAPEEWQTLEKTVNQFSAVGRNLLIDDSAGLQLVELRAKARRWVLKQGVEILFVDYLQLLSDRQSDRKSGNREQEISAISRGLKQLAKELNIPVIALSQLSRAVETRGGSKRPQLSDLRESGSIEQDSDMVAFLYRPEYYQILEDENGQSNKGVAEFIIAKHRNGGLATLRLRFHANSTRFTDESDGFFVAENGNNSNENAFPAAEPPQNIIKNIRRMEPEQTPF